ncbi:hypothetical protein EZ313_17230 [Ramlibacter henchirensis]|uniref:SnoaL-like domain-containing protein n=1 Tax=Ramlibacter henchirensis TaxID=204072 RepID=A0A4Z0BUI3_9BURK|nr:hypothetical protein [Ramlibacter henchirensis]TFZ02966.1 hypothetical protein EZ313_17230 [Ramlibacter henchirensis]
MIPANVHSLLTVVVVDGVEVCEVLAEPLPNVLAPFQQRRDLYDQYVRRGGNWLIAKRTSHFVWRDVREVAAAAAR